MKNLKDLRGIPFLLAFILVTTAWNQAVSQDPVTENRDVKSFSELSVSGAYKVILIQGDKEGVVVSGDPVSVKETRTTVQGTVLRIHHEQDRNKIKSVQVTVYFKSLGSVNCSGAVTLSSEQQLKFGNLELGNSGASSIELDLLAGDIDIEISGSGALKLSGKAQTVDLDISGSGSLKASELQVQGCEVNISGAGVAEVDVIQALEVSVSGSGVVRYKGDPKITQDLSGAGKVMKM
jgi:hypothetical protein